MTGTLRVLSKCFAFVPSFALAFGILVVALMITFSGSARADEPAKIVIVVEGGGGEALAAAMGGSLPEPWRRADPKAVTKAATTRKLGGAKSLDVLKTKIGYVERLLLVTDDVGAAAVVVVRVPGGPAKKGRAAKVVLFGAGNRVAAVDTTVKLAPGKEAAAIDAAIAPELAQLVPPPTSGGSARSAPEAKAPAASPAAPKNGSASTPATSPPASSTPTTAPSDTNGAAASASVSPSAAAAAPAADGAATHVLLDASIGVDFSSRHFDYNDAVTSNLRPYDVDFVPTPAVKLELYPLAKGNGGLLRDIGLTGALHAALGLDSKAPDGTTIATTWTRIDVGLRARFMLGSGETPPVLGVTASYGRETFAFRDQGLRIRNELPSVSYELLRLGPDVRVPLGPVALVGGLYYLPVLHSGDVGKRIRDQNVAGIEAELGVVVPFARRFEARVALDYRRFFYSFDPVPGDAVVAGGALDQLIRGELALAFVY